MPYIHVSTSKKVTDADKERIMKDLGQKISILKGKSEQWLMVKVSDEQAMCFQGDKVEPCAIIEVSVYGTFSGPEYQRLTGALTETVESIASIPGERIYVKYFETPHWGWKGSNF